MKRLLLYLTQISFLLLFTQALAAQAVGHKNVPIDLKNAGSHVKSAEAGDRVLILVAADQKEEVRITYLSEDPQSGALNVTIKENEQLLYVNMSPTENEPDGSVGHHYDALNRVGQSFSPLGLDGRGKAVLVKEGALDSLDVDLRGQVRHLPTTYYRYTDHSSFVSTVITGNGVSAPNSMGVAPGALVYSSRYGGSLPEVPLLYYNRGITVQNQSYSRPTPNEYGINSAEYDRISGEVPGLLFVASAGNSAFRYNPATEERSPRYLTLGGMYKMAKNILLIGAQTQDGNMEQFSSRGPTYDWRLKPDFSAFGEFGTSGASAIVSGQALLLQKAYVLTGQPAQATSCLLRAAMIASTTQIGDTPGPSFIHGHGALNGEAALDVILNEQFFQDELSEEKSTVTIPLDLVTSGSKLRVCLSWIDPPAFPGASRALINNLDLMVVGPDGETTLPWTVDRPFNIETLGSPFRKGKDNLNVNEVVEIPTPATGSYQLIVSSDLPLRQRFSVAYHLEEENEILAFSYPEQGDFVSANTLATAILWTGGFAAPAELQWKLVRDGSEWETVAAELDLASGVYSWEPPVTSGPAQLRIIRQDGTITTSETFLLAPPLEVNIQQNCGNTLMANWQELGPDFQVQLWRQVDTEMELVEDIANSSLLKDLMVGHYQLRAVHQSGMEVTPSKLFEVTETGNACYLDIAFITRYWDDQSININTTLLSRYQLAAIELEQLYDQGDWEVIETKQATELEGRDRWQRTYLPSGTHRFRFTILLEDGTRLPGPETSINLNFEKVAAFPNPAGQYVSFSSPPGWFREGSRFTIINALGLKMKTRELFYLETFPVLSLSELPNGFYNVRIDLPADPVRNIKEEVYWTPLIIQK